MGTHQSRLVVLPGGRLVPMRVLTFRAWLKAVLLRVPFDSTFQLGKRVVSSMICGQNLWTSNISSRPLST